MAEAARKNRLRKIEHVLSKALSIIVEPYLDREDDNLFWHFALQPFQFPEPIRQQLTLLEAHVYEAAVNDYLVDIVKNNKSIDINELQETLDNVQIVKEVA
ncbi:hypothetical protein CAEBREN_09327 [Caenorhabditis brenneri]|uniref:Uncharacterized protein n=1 Tax=Caenorhabditis brenneri TaxID=135651 RepID=G0PDL3_CAEBE|nr:hypothetical protein CAEBREN_09327 [Caenorhabditis brenneri]